MKILLVCHRFPFPPKRGGKIRPFNIIRHLHDQGHEVHVASLARSPTEFQDAQGIAEFCTTYHCAQVRKLGPLLRMIVNLPQSTPSSMGYFHSSELRMFIDTTVERSKPDLIIGHCSSIAPHIAKFSNIPKILDFGDMDSQKWLAYAKFRRWPLNWGFYWEGLKLQDAEKRLAKMFTLCTCTSKLEWKTLNDFGTAHATDWFPNGVDSDYFQPTPEPFHRNVITFIGRMDYYPNQECVLRFSREIFPMLRRQYQDLRFLIVGADPPAFIRKLQAIDGIEVTGSVPDVRPHVQRSHLMVAPLSIARGTQNKILEAMAMGVPVVSSDLAAQGVDATPGEHFLTATSNAAYIREIDRILSNDAERERLSQAGRQRMLSHHAWHQSMKKLDGIIERCLELHRSAQNAN